VVRQHPHASSPAPAGTSRRRPRWIGNWTPTRMLPVVVLAVLLLAAIAPPAASAQDEPVPPAGPPRTVSERLREQGQIVPDAEAAYLDADEQVQEQFLQALIAVELLSNVAPTLQDWRAVMAQALRHLASLDPDPGPVPPTALQAVHAEAVRHRERLRAAAEAWLAGVEADDPAWRQRGAADLGAAEQARLLWHRALLERYAGRAIPGPR
jgi:hypothetical protein